MHPRVFTGCLLTDYFQAWKGDVSVNRFLGVFCHILSKQLAKGE